MHATIIRGRLLSIEGDKIMIERPGYGEPEEYTFEGDDINNEDWVLQVLGQTVECKLIDNVVRDVVVY